MPSNSPPLESISSFAHGCICSTWARAYSSFVFTPHHRNCEHFAPESEILLLEEKLSHALQKLNEYEAQFQRARPQWHTKPVSVLRSDTMTARGLFPTCGIYAFVSSQMYVQGRLRNGIYHAYNLRTDLPEFSSDDFGEVMHWIEAKAMEA